MDAVRSATQRACNLAKSAALKSSGSKPRARPTSTPVVLVTTSTGMAGTVDAGLELAVLQGVEAVLGKVPVVGGAQGELCAIKTRPTRLCSLTTPFSCSPALLLLHVWCAGSLMGPEQQGAPFLFSHPSDASPQTDAEAATVLPTDDTKSLEMGKLTGVTVLISVLYPSAKAVVGFCTGFGPSAFEGDAFSPTLFGLHTLCGTHWVVLLIVHAMSKHELGRFTYSNIGVLCYCFV